MPESGFHRFLGGSPAHVILRLVVISLIVGAAMVYFNMTPRDFFEGVRRLFENVLGSGLESLHTLLLYVAYGAMVVVPIFVIVRLLKMARRP